MSCFIIATPDGGGAVFKYFSALGAELASRGHRVIIILDEHHYEAVNRENNPATLTWPTKQAKSWRDAMFLHSLIRKHHPICIISNFSAENICTLVGWLDRVPARVSWSHTPIASILMDAAIPKRRLRYLLWRKRLILKRATHYMAVCEALKEELQSTFGVPANKIRLHRFLLSDPAPIDAPFRPNVILCPSRHVPCKGQDVLVHAAAIIREACPGAIVEFLSTGPTLQRNERLAASLQLQETCKFLGVLRQRQVQGKMASAAVVAVPSLEDGFPLVTIEAASVGVPVVGSAVGGIKDMIVDGKTGFIVPPGDPRALAERIILILKSDELRGRLGRAARERFEASFSMRSMPQHADIFEALIS